MKALAPALVEFQKNAPRFAKDSPNQWGGMYASMHTVMAAVLPAASAVGLAVSQHPCELNGFPALRTILMHESGETLESTMLLAVDKGGPQAQGSALTYARRYAVLAVLGLVADEDDDGEAATREKGGSKDAAAGTAPSTTASVEEGLTVAILAAADKLGAKAATEEAIAKSKAERTPAEHVAWLRRNLKTAEANVKTLEETTKAAQV